LVAVLLWVVMAPLACIGVSTLIKDNSRLVCLPILISNIIFGFLMFFMSAYIILEIILYSQNETLRYLYLIEIGVIILGYSINYFYSLMDKSNLIVDENMAETGNEA
jgi:hypothetical protein